MAKNRVGLQFDGLEQMISNLEKASVDVREATESALLASKQLVTSGLVRDTVKANLPAKGKYSTGDLAKSIDKDYSVNWAGFTAEVKVGYDFSKSGLASIMVLYGTPRMKPAKKLYNDIYGSRIKKQLAEVQQEALNKVLERAVRTDGG